MPGWNELQNGVNMRRDCKIVHVQHTADANPKKCYIVSNCIDSNCVDAVLTLAAAALIAVNANTLC